MLDKALKLWYTLAMYKDIIKNFKDRGVARLILETCDLTKDTPVFNLTDDDIDNTVSLKRLFLKYYQDPTEISFVDKELCGKYGLWSSIKKLSTVNKVYKEWKEEAKQRYLALKYRKIEEIANDEGNKARFQALKYLSDVGYYEEKAKNGKGRPSASDKEQYKREYLDAIKEDEEALKRINQSSIC